MTDNEDHYYIDIFNFMDTKYLRNGSKPMALEGTQRLYTTTTDGDLDKCIMIAPYIDPVQYIGRNSWSDGAGSMMDNITNIFNNVMSNFNDMIINAQGDFDRAIDFLKAMFPKQAADLSKHMDTAALKQKIQALLDTIPSGEYKAINIGSFKKQYLGSSIEPPVTSLSAMYFSNPGDFKWFDGSWTEEGEKQPLRKMCAILMRILVGDIDCFIQTKKTGGENSIVQYAPMGIESRKLEKDEEGKSGGMKRIIGRTFAVAVSDTHQNDKGTVRVIRNLLPESITITPSRILTRDNDYYYVKIDVTFSLATYIGAQDVAQNWIIDQGGNIDWEEWKAKPAKPEPPKPQ